MRFGAVLLFSCSCLPGCVTNHDDLAATGAGGSAGTGGVEARATGGRDAGKAGDASSNGGAPTLGMEPPGPRKLTFVHGVVDAKVVSFCFEPVRDGGTSSATGAPLPAGGLEYGASYIVTDLPGLDLARDGVRPYVVAADPSAIAGLDCAALTKLADVRPPTAIGDASFDGSAPDASAGKKSDAAADAVAPRDAARSRDASLLDGASDGAFADAAPPPIPGVRVSSLPVIPPGTFSDSRSYLLVIAGCIGGPGVVDPSVQSVCGSLYTPEEPTLEPILVELSRIVTSGHVGLDALNASVAVPEADFVLAPAMGTALTVASALVPGELRPQVPNASRSASSFDLPLSTTHVQISASGSSMPGYDQPVAATLAAGGFADFVDGSDYTLVLVGPFPGFAAKKWWNGPLVTAVANAP